MRFIVYSLTVILVIFAGLLGVKFFKEKQSVIIEKDNISIPAESKKITLQHRDQEIGLFKKDSTTETVSRQQTKIQTSDRENSAAVMPIQKNDIQPDNYDEEDAAEEGLDHLWEEFEARNEDILSDSNLSIDLEALESSMREAEIPEKEIGENLEGLTPMEVAAGQDGWEHPEDGQSLTQEEIKNELIESLIYDAGETQENISDIMDGLFSQDEMSPGEEPSLDVEPEEQM